MSQRINSLIFRGYGQGNNWTRQKLGIDIQSSKDGQFATFPNSVRPMRILKDNCSKSKNQKFMNHHITAQYRDKIRPRAICD